MIRLHHCPGTRSMRVLWLLQELELEFEVVEWPFDRTLQGESFRTINPLGRVPVLEIGGEVMTESGAMIAYLCERFPERGLGRGPADPDRMDWLQWVHFAETVSQHCAALTQQHVVLREDAMRSPVVMQIEAARLARCVEVVEARLSTPVENRDHLLTSGFSAADVAVGQAVWMARHFLRLEPWPEVRAWLARLMARPAFVSATPRPDTTPWAQAFYAPWPVPQ